jgi:hypothetical protein
MVPGVLDAASPGMCIKCTFLKMFMSFSQLQAALDLLTSGLLFAGGASTSDAQATD